MGYINIKQENSEQRILIFMLKINFIMIKEISAFGEKTNYSRARGVELAEGQVALFRGIVGTCASEKVMFELSGSG